MSIRVMSLVWAHSQLSGSGLLTMLAIADWADDEGRAYPAINTLAKKCRLSERGTRYGVHQAERVGELLIEANAGPGGANLYRVLVQRTINNET
jgi:hypothetical protein